MKRDKWFRILYLLISVLAFYYLGTRIISFEHWNVLSSGALNSYWFVLLFVQFLLWSANIGLESLRWNYLLAPFSSYGFRDSVKMVFTAFSAGSFTPMKLGEHGGRLIFLKSDDRATGMLASVYSSYLNSFAILLIAVLALPVALHDGLFFSGMLTEIDEAFYYPAAAGVLTLSFFLLRGLTTAVKKNLRNTRWAVKNEFFQNLRFKRAVVLFLLTLLRVIVYNLQLWVWFRIFNIDCPADIFFILSPLYFAAITLVPGMLLLDLGIRGSAGLFVFAFCSSPEPLLISLFALWFINVAIPAASGSLILIFKKHQAQTS
jgi:hypothetical protein